MLKRTRIATSLLAAIGGLAAMIAGVEGHYHADHSTPKKKSNRVRTGRGRYGETLKAHFDGRGINWSAKKQRVAASYRA